MKEINGSNLQGSSGVDPVEQAASFSREFSYILRAIQYPACWVIRNKDLFRLEPFISIETLSKDYGNNIDCFPISPVVPDNNVVLVKTSLLPFIKLF